VDPIDPQIHVVHLGQRASGEGAGLILPLLCQPGHRRTGQAGSRADELLQRGHEIPRRQPMQVQQRQHLRDLRRLTRPRRQDRPGEPAPRPAHLIDSLVVDPRRTHRHRTCRCRHVTGLVVAVADHQPAAILIDLVDMSVDVGGDLALQRRRQHLPSTLAGQLIEHRPADRGRGVPVGLRPLVNYGKHGVPSRTSAPTPVLITATWTSDLPREGAPLHARLAKDHPQILIIARAARPTRPRCRVDAGDQRTQGLARV